MLKKFFEIFSKDTTFEWNFFRVTACDIRHTPLDEGSVNVAVFSLSLMATNANEFILEANRILINGGKLIIAEVKSRIENEKKFVRILGDYGFKAWFDFTFLVLWDNNLKNKKV